ncbi:MAG: nucleotidyltransferase family protein [Reyranella sp.]|uniref:nucleotidyltransferase domain-containing protein n=1 Tax=Reyranella sp. TaxID=1929291 RepID=UPI003D102FEF
MVSPKARVTGAEFDTLCLLVRPRPDLVRAGQALQAGVDVAALCGLAAEHRVRPRTLESLGLLPGFELPASAKSSLETFRRLHSVRVLSLVQELRRLGDALTANGVRFATFKGPTLAARLYGDVAGREYSDIDLIVPRAHYEGAEQTLAALGYRGVQGDRAFRRAFLAHLRQCAFAHPDVDATVDLHWDFRGIHLPFPLAPDDIWERLEPFAIGGATVPTIGGLNLALLLAGHGTKEAWRSLDWICDVAMLVEHSPDLDWSEIHQRARQRRCGDSVLLACTLADQLLGTPLPAPLAGPLAASARVPRLASALIEELRQGRSPAQLREGVTDIDLCETAGARIRAVLTLALACTAGDYAALPLPRPLWPLYHAIRPFRLAGKALVSLAFPARLGR